ncbi:MAG: DUF748 domain-containing protein [Verrucomicrobiae bacterium]|nr:DUF748 domain-containing protein [Verrucomicrobiae bacterium]
MSAASAKVPASHRSRRAKRWRNWLALGVGLYALIGFLLLPVIIKWQLPRQLAERTHRATTVQQVRANPFTLSLTVRGLSLMETNGTPFASMEEFYANFQLSSLWQRAWTFDQIRLVRPQVQLSRFTNGAFNISDLVAVNTIETNFSNALPALQIRSLLVTNALVTLTDAATEPVFHARYEPIHIQLTDFSTHGDAAEPYHITATASDGERLEWSGRFSLAQRASDGHFKLSGLSLTKYNPYLSLLTTATVARGSLEVNTDYRLNFARQSLELEVTNAAVELRNLAVNPPERSDPLLTLDRLQITNAVAQLAERRLQLGGVSISGGAALVERATNGALVAVSYLKSTATSSAAPAAPWQLQLDQFTVTNFNLTATDFSTTPPAGLGLEHLALALKDFTTQTHVPFSLTLAGDWRDGGALALETHGTLWPLNQTASIAVKDWAIPSAQPYLSQYLNLAVQSGKLSAQGQVKFDPNAEPLLQFTGSGSVTDFASTDTLSGHELARWQEHIVRGVNLTLRPNQISIEQLKFTGARNNLVINSNRQFNVASLAKLPERTNSTTRPRTNHSGLDAFPIHIGAMTLEHNSLRLVDDSLPRRFEWSIADINGSVSNIVLPGQQKAQIDLHGEVAPLAPFAITGALTPDPQNLFTDLTIACTNTDLTALSPYTEKFVGRPLTKGKLTTALHYQIEARQLVATNFADLAQLTLGARVESPDALKLPIKLAIGLLKDMDGHIVLNVPLSGSLDDPKFSIWRLVGQTLQNLVVKAAAAPFSLLGALVGGGSELQFVEFDPGDFSLRSDQTNKLVKLGAALEKRTELTLEIRATYDPQLDVAALGRNQLRRQMENSRKPESTGTATGGTAPEEATFNDADYDRWLREAYQAAFNTTPEQALAEKLHGITNAGRANWKGGSVVESNARNPQKGATGLLESKSASSTSDANSAEGGPTATNPMASELQPELVRAEMEQRLLTLNPVPPEALQTLTEQRIVTVKKFMIMDAGISADRILPTTDSPPASVIPGTARVEFSLD